MAHVVSLTTAPVPSAVELTETMVKVQRDAFASMMGAADIHARDITLNGRRTTDRTDGADRTVGSSATASTPDRIEGNRR